MNKKIRVLIFPAGEVNSIEIHAALSTCVNIEVFGASSVDRHGAFIFKNYFGDLPYTSDPLFYDEFNKVIKNLKIDIVFPTHDSVANLFAHNSEKIAAKIVVADPETAEICRDKAKTYKFFERYNFIPRVYSEIKEFPVFIKPIDGQGGQEAKLIRSSIDIPKNIDLDRFVISEYLPGEEYTIDCLTDCKGQLKVVSPRSRERVMAGISVSSRNKEATSDILQIAEIINSELKFSGLWFFQIKKDIKNSWKLLEISTRCAGSMCLTRVKGKNLPLLSVYTALGYPIEILENKYDIVMDRTLISRYEININYDTVYFDFDDTLIIDQKVHLPSIWFLYQCKNKAKNVILLTRHEHDLSQSLKEFSISESLFIKIIHLYKKELKSNYIDNKNSIFIDNSFIERYDVNMTCGIPVFDVDALEVLMDWKC